VSGPVVGMTIATTGFLPRALVLARSWAAHHDGQPFVVVHESDDPPPFTDAAIRFVPSAAVVPAGELARLRALNGRITALALKPWALTWALDEGAPAAVYLDADGVVYGNLADLGELAATTGFVVTPHLLDSGDFESERTVALAGTMNAGCVAAGPAGREVLLWWARRCAQDARVAPDRGVMSDQRWLDLLLGRPEVAICGDPGVNLHWPRLLHSDTAFDADGMPTFTGRPLRFLHTGSSFHPDRPWTLGPGIENHGVALDERPNLRALLGTYAEDLRAARFHELVDAPIPGTIMDDGTPVDDLMRDLYREGIDTARRSGAAPPPGPFDADGGAGFRRWLREPVDRRRHAVRASRYLVALADRHPEVRDRAPGRPDDEFALLAEKLTPLVDERAAALLDSGLAAAPAQAWEAPPVATVAVILDADPPLEAWTHARWAVALLDTVDEHTRVVPWNSADREHADSAAVTRLRSDVWVYVMPPERSRDVTYDLLAGLPHDRRRVCWWPTVDDSMDLAGLPLDELWVADEATAARVREAHLDARVVPTPALPRPEDLPAAGVPAGEAAALALVDLATLGDDPAATVDVLLDPRPPALVLGVLGAAEHPAQRTWLGERVAGLEGVTVRALTRHDAAGLAAVVLSADALLEAPDDEAASPITAAAAAWARAAGIPILPAGTTALPLREAPAGGDAAATSTAALTAALAATRASGA